MQQREGEGADGVHRDRAHPAAAVHRKAVREPEDERRQRRRHVPIGKIEDQQAAGLDFHRPFDVEGAEAIRLERGEEAKGGRGAKNPSRRRGPDSLHRATYRPGCNGSSSVEGAMPDSVGRRFRDEWTLRTGGPATGTAQAAVRTKFSPRPERSTWRRPETSRRRTSRPLP